MNTKGIKFLAVLAVMAMAFAAFAAVTTADDNDAIVVFDKSNITIVDSDTKTITAESNSIFYVPEDTTLKIRSMSGAMLSSGLTFYVQNGKVLELDFKPVFDEDDDEYADISGLVTIYTVSGDQGFQQNVNATDNTHFDGKQVFENTAFTFVGERGMSVFYKAASSSYSVSYNGTSFTYSGGESNNAQVSADKEFTNKPIVGTKVEVATGQTIAVRGTSTTGLIANLVYGIEYTAVSGSDYTYTYYAKTNNAGDIAFDNANDSVVIKNGSVAITTSGTVIKASSATSSAGVTVSAGSVSGSLAATGQLGSGSMNLSGKVNPNGLNIDNGATVTIANKAEIITSATMDVDGKLIVKTAGSEDYGMDNLSVVSDAANKTGVLVLQNGKLWTEDASGITITTSGGFNGLYETSAISTTYYGEVGIATATIAKDQTYTMDGNTTIKRAVVVEGIMVVNEGVTLTLDNAASVTMQGQFAQIINNGKIVVKAGDSAGKGLFVDGGLFTNNGTVEFSAKSWTGRTSSIKTFEVTSNAIGFINNGSVTISKLDNVAFAAFTDNSGIFVNNGTMTIGGKVVAASTIADNGRIVYNGTELYAGLTTVLGSKDASAFVSSVKLSNGNFIVSYGTNNITVSASGITAEDKWATVRGVTFTGSTFGTAKAIDTQGAMSFAIDSNAGTSPGVTFAVSGKETVKSSFSVPNEMTLAYNSGAGLYVPGTMTINKDATITGANALSMEVTGKVIDYTQGLDDCSNFVAAKYVTSNSVVFTTLVNAIPEAVDADVMTISIGAITVENDIIIPAGMTIDGDNGVTIGTKTASPTVTIESTGRLSANANLVNGTIFAYDSADVSDDQVFAHVKEEDGDSVTYKSLNVALAEAERGDVINLNKYFVLKDSSMTIPEGVMVDATASDVATPFVVIGSNLAVNGTLLVDGFYFIAETDETVATTVGGFIKDETQIDIKAKWFTPVGVSYTESTFDPRGDEVTYFVITNLNNLQQAVDSADEKKVTVEGKAKLGDVTIRGTEDEPAEVTFNDDISAGTITLENAAVIAKSGNKIDATFADEYGAIIISGAYVAGEKKEVDIYSLGDKGVYMRGPITDCASGTYSIKFIGKTGMNNAIIGWGEIDTTETPQMYPTVTFAGDTLVTGNKNQISWTAGDVDPSNEDAGVITILGDVTVDNGSKLYIVADTEVLGSLVAKSGTASSTNGNIEIEANIFLGTAKSAIYDAKALVNAYKADDEMELITNEPMYGHAAGQPYVADSAKLSGKVDLGEGMFITKTPSASIDDSIVEDMKFMTLIVDGKEWITVYGTTAYSMDGLKAPIENSTVADIVDINGDPIDAKYSKKYGVIYGHIATDLEAMGTVFVSLDYKIYTVLIKTDASIKAVYIDDILTYTGNEENQFFLYRVEAGTHTVAVEPATGYNADKAYLYDENGKKLSGLKFTFDESDCIWVDDVQNLTGYYEVIYNVAGTEKIVDPEPLPPEQVSEWTVTTILLLVLVILIAVMAVIVALRLNRS